jgi:hypothetical protein
LGWFGRTFRAIAFARNDPDTVLVALAGFLLRGGMAVLLVPSLALPSVIGAAAVTGVDAFGIDGRPTLWLVEVAAVVALVLAIWLLVAFVVGSLIDAWLIEAALDPEGHAAGRARPLPSLGIVLDLAGIRAICALPLLPAVWWAGSRIYTATYNELTAPTSLSTPIALRVLAGAADGFLLLGSIWLVTEAIGAIAIRRVILLDHGAWRALAGAVAQVLRRPIKSLATLLISVGSGAIAVMISIAATATAFDWCRLAARSQDSFSIQLGSRVVSLAPEVRPLVFILAAAVLGLAWITALAVSGFASAWRSAAFTEETAAATAATTAAGEGSSQGPWLGLSGPDPERSGD